MRRTEYLMYYLDDPVKAFKSLGWRTWHRTHNRWLDLRAVLVGACNADTWDADEGRYWAYPHWRCGKRRGHPLPHRFVNYTWAGPGVRPVYDPMPVRGLAEHRADVARELPFNRQTTYRHGILPLRRQRQVDRYNDRKFAELRAELQGEIKAEGQDA